MDRGAWRATVHKSHKKLDMTEQLVGQVILFLMLTNLVCQFLPRGEYTFDHVWILSQFLNWDLGQGRENIYANYYPRLPHPGETSEISQEGDPSDVGP